MDIKFIPILLLASFAFPRTLNVGTGQTYATLSQAAGSAQPGDTILIHGGTYAGGAYISGLQGNAANWIHILNAPGDSVIFNGGSQAFQMSDPAYVHISGLIIQAQTGNGVNIDDGGTYATPAKHLIIENCIFRDMNATGNNDQMKLSGVDSFEVRNCTFLNGSAGGSGIDMVGCHNGVFKKNYFGNQGSNSIQAKGGSQFLRIEENLFVDGGERSVNLGGSTGLPYFRPDTAHFEAADLKVYSNIFVRSTAPIAYVGSTRVEVANNTIYMPENWVIRILQETVDTVRFVPCEKGVFRNNIIYLGNISTECNVGSNTDAQSFTFSNNLWYNYQNASWTGPRLPKTDSAMIRNQNPLFQDAPNNLFSIPSNSPAVGKGYPLSDPAGDYSGRAFASPRSIGAFEGAGSGISLSDFNRRPSFSLEVFPSPFCNDLHVRYTLGKRGDILLSVYDMLGRRIAVIEQGERAAGAHLAHFNGSPAPGACVIVLKSGDQALSERLIRVK